MSQWYRLAGEQSLVVVAAQAGISTGCSAAAGSRGFFVNHRGFKYPSSVLMQPITDGFVAGIHRYVEAHASDLVHVNKGQRKDDVAHRHLSGGRSGRRGAREHAVRRADARDDLGVPDPAAAQSGDRASYL